MAKTSNNFDSAWGLDEITESNSEKQITVNYLSNSSLAPNGVPYFFTLKGGVVCV